MNAASLKTTYLLKVSLVMGAALALCLLALLMRVEPSHATFPGKNGKIAFSSNRDGHVQKGIWGSWPSAEIYVMDADGSNPINVTNDPGSDDFRPTYSPDGTKLAFVSYREGSTNKVRVHIMNSDGSGVRYASDAAYTIEDLRWSPDGTKLAFSSRWYDDGFAHDIWVMDANSSGQTNISADSGFYKQLLPTWSPDGSKIAFQGLLEDEGYYGDIYVMDADGSNITSLTDDRDIPDGHPEWSPDGSKIMFTRSVPNGFPPWWENTDIYVMNTDGSDVTRLTRYPGTDWVPQWSPDGSKIMFQRERRVDGHFHIDVYVMNADGSNKLNVSSHDAEANNEDAAWSPDGTKIVFTSYREGDVDQFGDRAGEIYAVNADGSNPTNISNNPANDAYPDWQPLNRPTTKAECKRGGYKEFGFKSQGQCIASVQRAAKSE